MRARLAARALGSRLAVSGGFSSLQIARAAYERDYILRELGEKQSNVSRAARVLGLERSHLRREMKSLGITLGHQATRLRRT